MKFKIINPKEDIQGNKKENIFIVMNEEGYIGNGYVFPKLSSVTPNHPLNIFIDMSIEDEHLYHAVGIELFHKLRQRAVAIAREEKQQAMLYYGSDHMNEKISFFKAQGFNVVTKTYKLTTAIQTYDVSPIDFEIRSDNHLHEADDLIELHNEQLITPLSNELVHKFSHKDDFNLVRLYDREVLIGAIMMYRDDFEAKIDHIVIKPGYQNKGLGKFLMQEAMKHFEKKLVSHMALEVWSANLMAMKFYQALGFKNYGETEYYVGQYL